MVEVEYRPAAGAVEAIISLPTGVSGEFIWGTKQYAIS
jgi:hypothetical protein